MPKNLQTTTQLHSSHMPAKKCSKFSKPALQQHVNHKLPDVQAGFRKGRGTRDQIANNCWIIKKARDSWKTSSLASLTTPKPLTVWITRKCGKFLSNGNTRPPYLPPEIYMQVKKQQLKWYMEQQTGSKLAGVLSAALSQLHLWGFEIAQLEFHHLH